MREEHRGPIGIEPRHRPREQPRRRQRVEGLTIAAQDGIQPAPADIPHPDGCSTSGFLCTARSAGAVMTALSETPSAPGMNMVVA